MIIIKKILIPALCISTVVLLFANLQTAGIGATKGLMLCGKTIIPTLLPAMVLILLSMRILPANFSPKFEKLLWKLFGCSSTQLSIFLFALIGGYPIGARLIAEAYESKQIDKKTAQNMTLYCVNAGPGFVISAIGVGIFGDFRCGLALFSSVTIGDLLLMSVLHKTAPLHTQIQNGKVTHFSTGFTSSVTDAMRSVLEICSYIIMFSVLTEILGKYFRTQKWINICLSLSEVTNGVTLNRNLYIIAFLIAFGGLSVFCQILTLGQSYGVPPFKYLIIRILHGMLSMAVLRIYLFLFPIEFQTVSNHVLFETKTLYSSVTLCISLFVMILLLLFTVAGKNNGGNLKTDMLQ